MSQSALEKRLASIEEMLDRRLASLEQQMTALKAEVEKASQPDWRRSVGIVADTVFARRVDAAGQAIREKERERARAGLAR